MPLSWSFQGQFGWVPGQPDLLGDIPAHGSGLELDAL